MGLEATCEVRFGDRTVSGTARLESEELLFRGGDLKLRISFRDVKSVAARGGRLELSFGGGKASFALGPAAQKWALKVRYPRGLMDKLGVKPGLKVSAVGLDDAGVLVEVRERAADVSLGRPRKGSDIVFVRVGSQADLRRLRGLRGSLKPNGAVWAIWTKGQKALTESDVRAAALAAGLVDVKVVSVSKTLSGLKLVIPVDQR